MFCRAREEEQRWLRTKPHQIEELDVAYLKSNGLILAADRF